MTAKALLERIIKIRKAIDYRRTKIDALTEQAENATKVYDIEAPSVAGALQEGRFGVGDHKAR